MFAVPADERVEFVHEDDVATAIVDAAFLENTDTRIFNIGGGESCQMTYKEFIDKFTSAMGLVIFPEEKFKRTSIYLSHLDTQESQRILQYQNHSFDDIVNDLQTNNKKLFSFVKAFRPIFRLFLS
ncbi:MAG: NAD(P)-dependent oxidoreductase [Asgard group archaeon]|nr:NAD(P)-dependent oxidoreductase [Asgard group archaeon]